MITKKAASVPTQFDCIFCNHAKTVECKLSIQPTHTAHTRHQQLHCATQPPSCRLPPHSLCPLPVDGDRNQITNVGAIKCRVCNVTFQMEINRNTHRHTTSTQQPRHTSHSCLPLTASLTHHLCPAWCPPLSDLHDPIDVYSEWIDQTEKANRPADEAEDNPDEPSGGRERRRQERDDEGDDVGDDEPSRDRSRYSREGTESKEGEEDEGEEADEDERRRARQRVKREARVNDEVDERQDDEEEAGEAQDGY